MDPIKHVKVREVKRDGRSYILIDTPGFGYSSNMADSEVRKCIHEAVKGLDFTVLLCLSVNSGNISSDSNKLLLKNLQSCLHDRIWEKCVLLFTFSDDLLRNSNDIQQYKDSITKHAESFQYLLNEIFHSKQKVNTVFDYKNEHTRKNSGFPGIVAVPVRNKQDIKIKESEEFTRDQDIIPGIPFSESWQSVVFEEINTKIAPLTLTNKDFKITVAIAGGTVGGGVAGVAGGTAAGAGIGAAIGAVAGPLGSGAGAAVGAATGGAISGLAGAGVGLVTSALIAYEVWVNSKPEDQIRRLRERIPR